MYNMQTTMRSLRVMRLVHPSRAFTTSTTIRSAWSTGPAPPRLPKEEQELFEKLQQQSTGAFSTPRQAEAESSQDASTKTVTTDEMLEMVREKARLAAKGDGEELHPNVRRGAAPEFQGDTNPKTGEVGGPKNEPLRWGVAGDWSYNGRVTDF
jgi:hypothetical protein